MRKAWKLDQGESDREGNHLAEPGFGQRRLCCMHDTPKSVYDFTQCDSLPNSRLKAACTGCPHVYASADFLGFSGDFK